MSEKQITYKDLKKKYNGKKAIPYEYSKDLIEFCGKIFPEAIESLKMADMEYRGEKNGIRLFGDITYTGKDGKGVQLLYQHGILKMAYLLKPIGVTWAKSSIMNKMVTFKNSKKES
jgi:hypothetical protein